MAGPPNSRRDAAIRNAQKVFSESERRNEAARDERQKERDAIAAKTARLRALRLAKEEAEKAKADTAVQQENGL